MNRAHVQVFPSIRGRCVVSSVSVPADPDVSDAPGSTVYFNCVLSYFTLYRKPIRRRGKYIIKIYANIFPRWDKPKHTFREVVSKENENVLWTVNSKASAEIGGWAHFFCGKVQFYEAPSCSSDSPTPLLSSPGGAGNLFSPHTLKLYIAEEMIFPFF